MTAHSPLVRGVNFAALLTGAAIGGWILFHLLPVLARPDQLKTNLITLPSLHAGLPPAVKVVLFFGMIVAGSGLVAWGIAGMRQLGSVRIFRLHRLVIIQVAVGLAFAELISQGAGFLNLWSGTMRTYLVNPACGEIYHRMVARPALRGSASAFDPELGWRPPAQPGNPDGLVWPPALDGRPKAWFFGDSFMQGVLGGEKSPPAFFEADHAPRQALNFAVGGYGVDQIWLRYRRHSERIPRGDPVIIGILTTDIDRSALGFFSAFKPKFEKSGDSYRLVRPPPLDRQQNLLTAEPVRIASYVAALARTVVELVETGFDRSEVLCNAAQKRAINAFLLDEIIAAASARGHDLRFVIFVPWPEFHKFRSWRHAFLRRALEDRGQKFLDTRELLAERAAEAGHSPEHYYIPGDGHLNEAGNRAVGKAMAKWMN